MTYNCIKSQLLVELGKYNCIYLLFYLLVLVLNLFLSKTNIFFLSLKVIFVHAERLQLAEQDY